MPRARRATVIGDAGIRGDARGWARGGRRSRRDARSEGRTDRLVGRHRARHRREPDDDLVSRTKWRTGIGLGIALAYGAIALVVSGPPVRPMFDCCPQQGYNWINPPSQFAPTNKPPERKTQTLTLGPNGSDA